MISVIVSTRKKDFAFIEHLKKTSGIKNIEVLVYENNNEYSLCEIYNKGLIESKNNIVIFCHDDIIMERKSWGRRLIKNFEQNNDYGILGVAGTKKLNKSGIWWNEPHKNYGIVNHINNGLKQVTKFSYSLNDNIENVVCLDGVFIAVMKDRIKKNFNEKVKGFHFYDITFCVENFINGVKLGVMTNIRITHKSIGMTNESFDVNKKEFLENYGSYLPLQVKINFNIPTINYDLKETPKLAIIIPTKDNFNLLSNCIDSLISNTKYDNYKIYVADTGSSENTKDLIKKRYVIDNKITLIEYDYYNFAKINNDVIKKHIDLDTELLLFCNNDIEMLNDSITEMVNLYLQNKESVGTIGGRLHYDDGYIQHLGIYLFKNKNNMLELTHNALGCDFNRLKIDDRFIKVMGNTAAFLMINKKLFEDCNYFNENYEICFEDVELNLQCSLRGKQNMLPINTSLYHFESQTRGKTISNKDYHLINDKVKSIGLFNKLKTI